MKKRLIFIIMIVAFILKFNACQNPNEPILDVEGVNVILKIETFEGAPISGVQVQYSKGNNFVPSGSQIFGNGFTNSNGLVSQIISIPTEGESNTFKLSINSNPGIPNEYLNKPYTFNFACKDSTYIIRLPITIQADCNETLETINSKKLVVCPKIKESDTLIIGPICLNCDNPVSVMYNLPTKIKNSIIIVKDKENNILNQNPFKLSANSCFYIYFIYDSKGEVIPLETDLISFMVNNGNNNYKLVDINLSAESICSECECPLNSNISYPSDSTFVDVCLGEEKEFNISLSKFINQNSKCDLKFVLDQDFANQGFFEIISFNNDNYTLAPNSSLGSIRLKVKGVQTKRFSDEIKFKVLSFNPEYNTTEDCNTKLTIKVNVEISDGKCEYDLNSTIFESKFKKIDSTVTMKSGIGTIDTKNIGVKNPSNCPLIISNFEVDNKAGQGRPFELLDKDGNSISFPIVIPKLTTYYFIVRFKPDVKDAYPPDGVRRDEMQDKFETNLRFITNSQNCELADIKLKGEIVSKSANEACMREANGNFKQGITFRNDGALVIDSSQYFIYFDSYNPVSGKATIKRVITQNNNVYVNMYKSSNTAPSNFKIEDICDIATDNNSSCDNAYNSTINEIDVEVGDIVAFNYFYTDDNDPTKIYTYCTIMVVESISLIKNENTYRLCFYTCTGI